MRTLTCSLLALLLAAAAALAAPAPFRKAAPEPDNDAIIAQIKHFMLREHGAHADRIIADGHKKWLVAGNIPMLTDDGRMLYQQRYYRVTVGSVDRRGVIHFEAEL